MFNKKLGVLCSVLVLLFGAVFSAGVMADAAELESEIKSYQQTFTSDSFVSKKKAIGELEWAGLSDERVYEPLAELILADIMTTDKATVKQLTYYIKGLSFSGNERYSAVLKKVVNEASNKHLIKHSLKALDRIEDHVKWNPVISNALDKADAGDNNRQRVKNMLSSNMAELQRVGAKRVYYAFRNDAELLESVKSLLLAGYKTTEKDKIHIDLMAWLCKALGASGDVAYQEVLQEVADNAGQKKVRKHAKKALRSL